MHDSSDPDLSSTSSDGLTSEELGLLKQRALRYSLAAESQATDISDAVVFRRHTTKYAIPLTSLREVRPLRSYCPIPCTSAPVPGIWHFRGEILSLHDVGTFMDPSAAVEPPTWVLVVEHQGERIGLAADEVLDVEQHSVSMVQPLPITFGDRGMILDGLLPGGTLLLSASRIFHTEAFFSAF